MSSESGGVQERVAAAAWGVTDRLARTTSQWRRGSFGPASEEPYRRRVSDWIRFAVASVVFIALARHQGDVTPTEGNLFAFFNGLPDGFEQFFRLLYALGALWAVALAGIAALSAGRLRLARDLAVAGGAAWLIGRLVAAIVVEHESLANGFEIVLRFDDVPSFPLVRLAVVAAVVAAASPYLTRPSRRLGQALVVTLAIAGMYLGTGLPVDIVGALVLGWGIAAAVHLAFGSPGGRPTRAHIQAALDELGITTSSVTLAALQPTGYTLFLADTPAYGAVTVKAIGRDERDASLLAKCWRFVAYRDSGPSLSLTRLDQIEHEAYAQLRAEAGGVGVPSVIVAVTAGPQTALLVAEAPDGQVLRDIASAQCTDELLDDIWGQAVLMHEARIAHGALNTEHVIVRADTILFTDFSVASAHAGPDSVGRDIAELLAATSTIVGEQRSVGAAGRVLGPDLLARGLPFLQTPALTRVTRVALGDHKEQKERLDRLRQGAADAAGVDQPELQQLYRVRGRTLAMAIGTLLAIGALLAQVDSFADLWATVQGATWWWVALAIVFTLGNKVGYAFALMGSVSTRLTVFRSVEAMLAAAFSNLAVPGVGGTAVQVRYLQLQGVDLASAVAAGAVLANVANVVVQGALFLLALLLTSQTIDTGKIDLGNVAWTLALIVFLAGVFVAVVFGIPRFRKRALPATKQAAATIWTALRSPRQVFLLVVGNLVAAFMAGLCLYACVNAYGGNVGFWPLLVVNLIVGTIASLVPVPGGNTLVSAVGLSAALVAFGVSDSVAVAAVLTQQIVYTYLPAIPGWFATNDMLRAGLL